MRSGFSIIVIAAALSLLGVLMLPKLPVKLFPSRELPSLTVSFSMPGNSSRVVEQEVTGRIEGALSRLRGVRKIDSRSSAGQGSVTVGFDRHTDMAAAGMEVSSILRQMWGGMPEGVSYPVVSTHRANRESGGPFMTYTVVSAESPMAIEAYVRDRVGPVLSDIPGVAETDVYGAYPMEWSVEYDSDVLSAFGLTPEDLDQAIRRHYGQAFLGLVPEGVASMRVVRKPPGDATVFNPADIVVRTPSGVTMTLDRLVKVRHSEGKPSSYFRINGLNSVYLNIKAEDTANQIETSDEIRRRMERVREAAPSGMDFLLSSDRTDSIREELDKIYFRSTLTVLILLLFVVAVTRDVRYTLLVAISLAVNIAVAIILYRMLRIEIQLYSLAGITISLNLIIDNAIVMCDHYMRHRDRRAFPAILAATLTTVGALVVVFLLEEEVRLNLHDFVAVVIVNLIVSLAVALFLVPALADRLKMKAGRRRKSRLRKVSKVVAVFLAMAYRGYIRFALRRRWLFLGFMAAAIGVAGWLFFEKVREGVYFNRDTDVEKSLYVNASLPNGSTVAQMDALVRRMEAFLALQDGIMTFETNVFSGQRASITVRFDREKGRGNYPYRLKSEIVGKALTLGGGSWSVYGLEDMGFNNDVRESAGSYRVKMLGFDYDELMDYAMAFRDSLMTLRRIKDVDVRSDFSFWKDDYTEFQLDIRREALQKAGVTVSELYSALSSAFGRDMRAGAIVAGPYVEPISLSSAQSGVYDIWSLTNMPFKVRGKSFKLSDFAEFSKSQAPQDIVKENQSYRLCLQFEYIGSPTQAGKILDNKLKVINAAMPAGYSATRDEYSWGWDDKDLSRYWLLGVVALIIFFISSVLFDSLIRPLAIMAVIPMSYVGIFLTFWLFNLKFDQGGFASFILLSGITVNAAIYLISEFEGSGRKSVSGSSVRTSAIRNYMKAFRAKITPILMTLLSTILGFLPFLVGTDKEGFWFPLAAGTIGGLVFSLFAIIFFLPLLILKRPQKNLLRISRSSSESAGIKPDIPPKEAHCQDGDV